MPPTPTNLSFLLNSTSLLITGTSLFINGTLVNGDVYGNMFENIFENSSACTACAYNYSRRRRSDISLVVFIVFIFLAGLFLGFGFGAGEGGMRERGRGELGLRREEGGWVGEKCRGLRGVREKRERDGDGESVTGFTLLKEREKREEMLLGSECERHGFGGGKEMERGWGRGVILAVEEDADGKMSGPWREPNLFLCS